MSSLIDEEINSCEKEIARLQEKKKMINKQKSDKKINDEAKLNKVEPNLAVFEKWLINQPGLDYDKAAEKAKEDYDNMLIEHKKFASWCPNNINDINPYRHECRQDPEFKIRKTYAMYHGGDRRITKLVRPYQSISLFGTDFAEATYNLFKIQQKRIEDLESKLQYFTYKPAQEAVPITSAEAIEHPN